MTRKSDTGPFSLIPEWVLDSGVSDRAVRLYCVLARYADKDGEAWPSRGLLAERLKCSRDSVDRAVRELVDVGALHREHRTRNGAHTSNLWTIMRVAAGSRPRSRTTTPGGSREVAAQNENHLTRTIEANDHSSAVDSFLGYDLPEPVAPPDLSSLKSKIVAHKGQRLPGEKPRE